MIHNIKNIDWDKIFTESNGLKKPVLLKRIFKNNFFEIENIAELIRTFSKDPSETKINQLRVYTTGRRHDLEELLLTEAPSESESLESWCHSLFKQEEFGVFINRAEIWSEELAVLVSNLINPVIKFFEPQKSIAETVLFIGNYGYSPFGIHQDEGDVTIFHIHLGPNAKDMTLWDKEKYLHANGSLEKNFNPSGLIYTGHSYREENGDLFLLPPYYYHVGYTPKFSITVAISITQESEYSYVENAAKYSLGELIKNSQKSISCSIDKWLQDAINSYTQNRMSNCYLIGSPIKKEEELLIEKDTIVLCAPFKIYYLELNNLEVFIRGRRIYFDSHNSSNYHFAIISMIKKINLEESISVSILLNSVKDNITFDAAILILTLFRDYGGIKKIDNL